MILANNPKGPEESPTEKAGRLGENLHHRTVQHFTVRKWWHTPLLSLRFMAFGLVFSAGLMIVLSQFPWDDSTFWQKLMTLLIASVHGSADICMLVVSVLIWADPYKLILDGDGGLILRGVALDRYTALEDIKTIVLAKQENGERGDDAPVICIKLSRGKLKLLRFAEREEFLKALKAVHPAIVVETV